MSFFSLLAYELDENYLNHNSSKEFVNLGLSSRFESSLFAFIWYTGKAANGMTTIRLI
jgi:hypothetical protein